MTDNGQMEGVSDPLGKEPVENIWKREALSKNILEGVRMNPLSVTSIAGQNSLFTTN